MMALLTSNQNILPKPLYHNHLTPLNQSPPTRPQPDRVAPSKSFGDVLTGFLPFTFSSCLFSTLNSQLSTFNFLHCQLSVVSFRLSVLLILLLLILSSPAPAQYAGGTGDPNNPFLISDPNHMNVIGLHPEHWDKHFKLMADIDLSRFSGTQYNIIGTDPNNPFKGSFNGDDYTISKFNYIPFGDPNIYIGLFGYVNDPNTLIKDLVLIDPDIDSVSGYVGALVGCMASGTINGCRVNGGNIKGRNVGGLMGTNIGGNINNCYATISVFGAGFTAGTGGLVGENYGGTITNSQAIGSVSGFGWNRGTGGLVGELYNGTISNCYVNGNVTGYCNTGGLVGDANWGTIYECNVDGTVRGENGVGGLIGSGYYIFISDCHTNVDVSGQRAIGGLAGGTSSVTISDCSAIGEVEGDSGVGGLAGGGSGTINNCYATGNVSGTETVGGLVGSNSFGIINYSYATGNVSGTDNSVGGLAGKNHYGTINNSYAKGTVTGYSSAGGLVGRNENGIIIDSYAGGNVTGDHDVGGLLGDFEGGVICKCYARGVVTGNEQVGGLIGGAIYNVSTTMLSYWDNQTSGQTVSLGGKGRTTAEMKKAETYEGWGFEPVWIIDEPCDYPHLWWENQPGEYISEPLPVYGGGSGDPNNPFRIYTSEQLNTIGICLNHWDKHFILMNDLNLIDYQEDQYNIIGRPIYIYPFSGVFDGCGHTIHNFTIENLHDNGVGLFGGVDDGGQIKNLRLSSPHIKANSRIGLLVGHIISGQIRDCSVVNGTLEGKDYLGGLAGSSTFGTISNCSVSVELTGNYKIGGLVGSSYAGHFFDCRATGNIEGNDRVGGLAGSIAWEATITRSYATCYVWGTINIGGLVGDSLGGEITNCYATGAVTGRADSENIGGLVGNNNYGKIINCYATGAITGGAGSENLGGLMGQSYSCSSVNSYASGSVTGGDNAECLGGLVGLSDGYATTISNCYATGVVKGGVGLGYLGGLVGRDWKGRCSYTKSFWNTTVNPSLTGVGNITDPADVIGETTENMQKQTTFTDVGWDFVGESDNGNLDYWRLCVDDIEYPQLSWQFPPGDFLCPDGVTLLDLFYFVAHWLHIDCDPSNNFCRRADLNHSNRVDLADFNLLAANYLKDR